MANIYLPLNIANKSPIQYPLINLNNYLLITRQSANLLVTTITNDLNE